MQYHVKAFYPKTFHNASGVIGCIVFSGTYTQAERVNQKLRRAQRLGYHPGDGVLYFVHDENGHGTSSLVTIHLS